MRLQSTPQAIAAKVGLEIHASSSVTAWVKVTVIRMEHAQGGAR